MKSLRESLDQPGDGSSPQGLVVGRAPVKGRRTRQSILPTVPLVFGLPEAEAAVAVGVSQTKFRELVADRTMPPARVVGGKLVYDVDELRLAFKAIPHQGGDAEAEVDTWADVISES
jgi:hypothetical protein